jgi:hypothetical protein
LNDEEGSKGRLQACHAGAPDSSLTHPSTKLQRFDGGFGSFRWRRCTCLIMRRVIIYDPYGSTKNKIHVYRYNYTPLGIDLEEFRK